MARLRFRPFIAAALVVLAPLLAAAQPGLPPAGVTLRAELVADGFRQPVFVASPPGDPRLFVVDQSGQIWIVEDGARRPRAFLNIQRLVRFGGEQGLLGLAFHPDYATNGRFYVNYTDTAGDTQVVAYRVSPDPSLAVPESAVALLTIDQPAGNHNGGWLGFGPDGYLYIATGDGGGGGDTYGTGQNPNSLLAKILRIDVDGGVPYAIPPGNPFANGGGLPEAWALGVRNPWRPAFDGNLLYVADVGQGAWEEITILAVGPGGANLGWSVMEGNHCFRARQCDAAGFVPAVHEYSHSEGCSITGGYVYRGSAIPEIAGHYFFADYCAGFVRSFRVVDGVAADLTDWTRQLGNLGDITSFGIDRAGEIYITVREGRVYRIVRGG